MRIAMVGSRGIYANYGGVESVLDELCVKLVECGHEVDVFGGTLPDVALPSGLKAIKVSSFGTGYVETMTRSLLATLKTIGRYDIVHFHAIGPGVFSLATKLLGQRSVVTIHGFDYMREKWGWLPRFLLRTSERIVARNATEITVLSEGARRQFLERYDRRPHYIPNAVPPKVRVEAGPFLASHGLTPGKYLLFASRLVPEKGCHDLIAAFQKLNTDFKLAIAGGMGPEGYIDSLRQMSDPGKTVFLGHLQGKELAEVFSNAYLFALPSYIEGMSMALLEATAFGIPRLISDIPENVAVTGDAGFTFPVGNIERLAETIAQLIEQPQRVAAMREHAAALPQTNWTSVAEMYDRLYQSMFSATASSMRLAHPELK